MPGDFDSKLVAFGCKSATSFMSTRQAKLTQETNIYYTKAEEAF